MAFKILVRHGESEHNAGTSEDLNSPLTSKGRAQAVACSREILSHLTTLNVPAESLFVASSPYERAVETSRIIANVLAVPFEVHSGLREFGPTVVIRGQVMESEDRGELVSRVSSWWRFYENRNVITVSHASPVAVLTQLAFHETPVVDGEFWRGVGNCVPRVIHHF